MEEQMAKVAVTKQELVDAKEWLLSQSECENPRRSAARCIAQAVNEGIMLTQGQRDMVECALSVFWRAKLHIPSTPQAGTMEMLAIATFINSCK